jgi:hypothetical protein
MPNAQKQLAAPTPISEETCYEGLRGSHASNVRPISDKRREARYPCNDPASVRVLNGSGGFFPATVLDVSRSGLRLEITVGLEKGMQVEITLPGEVIVFGEVRYCRHAALVYQAGVFIEDVFYARRADSGSHPHDDQLSLYLAKKGLRAMEVLGVRDHLLRCKLCASRYRAVVKLQERVGSKTKKL